MISADRVRRALPPGFAAEAVSAIIDPPRRSEGTEAGLNVGVEALVMR